MSANFPFPLFLLGGGGQLVAAQNPRRRGGSRKKKANKKTKKQPNNWFERLNATECKDLCKAAKLRVSGTKSDLVERLVAYDGTSTYAAEAKRGPNQAGLGGLTLESIKTECKDRDLPVSGTRFDLVLRILRHDHDTAPSEEGDKTARRRSATDDDDDVAPKKRSKKTTKKKSVPKSSKLAARIVKAIKAGGTDRRYDSHLGAKQHSEDVYRLMNEIMEDDVNTIDDCRAVFEAYVDNFEQIINPGYDMDGNFALCVERLEEIVDDRKDDLSDDEKEVMCDWIESVKTKIAGYCFADDAEPELDDILEGLRGSGEDDDEVEDDDDEE